MGVTTLPALAHLAEPDVVRRFRGLMVVGLATGEAGLEVEHKSGELHVQ